MSALAFSHLSSDTFKEESSKKAGRKRPRMREAVSCWQCRSRKIRCDRKQPCLPCVERNAGAKCTYSNAKGGSASKARPAEETSSAPTAIVIATATPEATLEVSDEPSSAEAYAAPPALMKSTARSSTRGSFSTRPSLSCSAASFPRSRIFQGSDRKTRFVNVNHWMAPCNDMKVVKALLTGSKEFQPSLQKFAGLKEELRRANSTPFNMPAHATTADGRLSPAILLASLPDRPSCEKWIGRYFNGYGRVFDMVDPETLAADVHQAFASPPETRHAYATAMNSIYILRILITAALGMQMSDQARLQGRQLGQLVADYIVRAARIQNPCIGSVQVLLQLILLKTVTASDTDAEHEGMGLLGLSNHITLSMGLHRDPALFEQVPPYYAEKRKRLWACFFRLHLAYCIRTGTQFPVRLEDCDCPLPTPSVLPVPFTKAPLGSESIQRCAQAWSLGEKEAESDAFFGHAAAKLAHIVAPIYQTLCSTKPRATDEQQEALKTGVSALMAGLPPSLRSGTAVADPMVELQRTYLSTCMYSFFLIVSLSRLFGASGQAPTSTTSEWSPAEACSAPRPELLEIWDYTIFVLNQFQGVGQVGEGVDKSIPKASVLLEESSADAGLIAHHLLWTDVGRAAFGACLVVGYLRRQEIDRALPFSVRPQQHHTAGVFQQMLLQSLEVLLQRWRSKYHLGPITAKTALLLAVTASVTANLSSDYDNDLANGVEAADQLVSDLKKEMKQRLPPTAAITAPAHVPGAPANSNTPNEAQQCTSTTTANALPLTASHLTSAGEGIQQMSSFSWNPMGLLDGSVSQVPDLSATSSTGSHAATPDVNVVAGGGDMFGMDFAAGMSFPLNGVFNSYGTTCPFSDSLDNTLMEFSGDTVMNMFQGSYD